ncbi:MAG: outer membrane protein assembly factor BamE [Hahellaceae bacterium]|nr:outer membrane protein assembly factor BamE [Hahellaceae bacterium]QIQ10525.1 Outer membrane protein assembly factor BamE [uncultured bacterium]
MQKFAFLLLMLGIGLTSGCMFPGVYRIDVQQGNIVEADMLTELRTGMTRRQVHYILGNPLLKNSFNLSEETYYYTMQLEGGEIHTQKVQLTFEGDTLSAIDHGPLLQPELANPGLVYKIRDKS